MVVVVVVVEAGDVEKPDAWASVNGFFIWRRLFSMPTGLAPGEVFKA